MSCIAEIVRSFKFADYLYLAAFLDLNRVLNFPTESRWLNGEEYAFLLRHYRAYTALYPDQILIETKAHPNQVYDAPRNG